MLSPGEVSMVNGYNPYVDQNIDIYVHTLVAPNTYLRQTQQTNENSQTNMNNNIVINNQGNLTNSHQNTQRNLRNRTSDISIQTGLNDDTRNFNAQNRNRSYNYFIN